MQQNIWIIECFYWCKNTKDVGDMQHEGNVVITTLGVNTLKMLVTCNSVTCFPIRTWV